MRADSSLGSAGLVERFVDTRPEREHLAGRPFVGREKYEGNAAKPALLSKAPEKAHAAHIGQVGFGDDEVDHGGAEHLQRAAASLADSRTRGLPPSLRLARASSKNRRETPSGSTTSTVSSSAEGVTRGPGGQGVNERGTPSPSVGPWRRFRRGSLIMPPFPVRRGSRGFRRETSKRCRAHPA